MAKTERKGNVGGFTRGADGFLIWYRGKTRRVAPISVPVDQLAERWVAKKRAIDAELDGAAEAVALAAMADDGVTAGRTFREVLAEFLAIQKARVGAARDAIELRTYLNKKGALNAFGNFVGPGGAKMADLDVRDVGPAEFTAYARTFGGWRASGFDSVVVRVGEMFRWAVEMEYLGKFRPGPQFVRPAKAELRSQRLEKQISFTPAEVAACWHKANPTIRCWIGLGCCAAFINSDVATLAHEVIDLRAGVIDFTRRKTGKVRRVIPLPEDVADLLRSYRRPEPAEEKFEDLFFLTLKSGRRGRPGYPYSGVSDTSGKPSCAVSRMFAKLMVDAGVRPVEGKNFKALRTTFRNLAPRGGYDLEREIVMGHAQGTVDLDSYLEDVGLDRIRHVVGHVWGQVRAAIDAASTRRPGGSAAPAAGPDDGRDGSAGAD